MPQGLHLLVTSGYSPAYPVLSSNPGHRPFCLWAKIPVRWGMKGSWGGLYISGRMRTPNIRDSIHKSKSINIFSQFSCLVVSNSLWPHGLRQARPPCPSPTPGVYWNSCPLSQWCHPTISSPVVPFSSCPQSFPASGSFQMSQFFASGGQSIGALASASVLPMNIQDWFPLGLTTLISLQSKGLSKVFSNTTVQKHQFFGAQLSL